MLAVFDGHNDALTREDYADLVAGRKGGHLDLPRMRKGGMRGGIFAVFTPSPQEGAGLEHAAAAAHATAVAGRLLRLEQAGEVKVARTVAALDAAHDDPASPPAAVLHLEGAEAIDPALEALDQWYAAGLRSMGPVWSRSNAFAHGVPFAFPSSPDTGPGLTDAGKALVERCGELGILVDLSHMNEAGFWDTARLGAGPLVASHSGAHALCPASRNLTDEQLDAIGASGGLVGVVFATVFLRPDFHDDPQTPLALIAEHARYVADRIGVEHVALGSDFDGATVPAALGDVAGLPKLVAALRDAGFSESELEAVCWHNWRRVLDAWWG
ncbi:MAG TPA: dipeptidase [Solirubrobacterales bacterium]|nr:dipeptidase [Solirubrobacterales bacterium]